MGQSTKPADEDIRCHNSKFECGRFWLTVSLSLTFVVAVSLEARVSACEQNFTKVKEFIRDSIGPDLGHVKTLVRAELRASPAAPKEQAESAQIAALRRDFERQLAQQKADFERQLAQQKAELLALLGTAAKPPVAAAAGKPVRASSVADELAMKLKGRVAADTSAGAAAAPPAVPPIAIADVTPAWEADEAPAKAVEKPKEKKAKAKKDKEARKAAKKEKKRASKAASIFDDGRALDDDDGADDELFGSDSDDDDDADFARLSSAVLGKASDAPPAHVVARALGLDKDDDEWSDEEAEVETLRLVVQNNKQLRALEDLNLKRPSRVIKRDVVSMATLSRANSIALKETVYFFGAGDYSELAGKVRHLAALGARILFHPMSESERWSFGVRASDRLFPVCPDGLGQSQVLFHVLSGVKRWLGVADGCQPPHGATSGFDPYARPTLPASDDPNVVVAAAAAFTEGEIVAAVRATNFEPRLTAPAVVGKAYEHAFGLPLVPRFGEPMAASLKYGLVYTRANQPVHQSIDTNVGKMREFFDLYYYDTQKASETQRYVYAVFGNALPVLFERLLENNRSLHNVWIVALPFENTASNSALVNSALTRMPPGTPPVLACAELYVQLYKDLAGIFRPLLQRKL